MSYWFTFGYFLKVDISFEVAVIIIHFKGVIAHVYFQDVGLGVSEMVVEVVRALEEGVVGSEVVAHLEETEEVGADLVDVVGVVTDQ